MSYVEISPHIGFDYSVLQIDVEVLEPLSNLHKIKHLNVWITVEARIIRLCFPSCSPIIGLSLYHFSARMIDISAQSIVSTNKREIELWNGFIEWKAEASQQPLLFHCPLSTTSQLLHNQSYGDKQGSEKKQQAHLDVKRKRQEGHKREMERETEREEGEKKVLYSKSLYIRQTVCPKGVEGKSNMALSPRGRGCQSLLLNIQLFFTHVCTGTHQSFRLKGWLDFHLVP